MSTARHTERVPGLHLRVARMQRGLAQRDVARQLGVSPRRISSLEGAAFVPYNTADRYFDALGHLVPAADQAAANKKAPPAIGTPGEAAATEATSNGTPPPR